MSSRRLMFGLTLCCVLCDATHTRASPLFEWLGDTSATGGLSTRSVPGGSAAAYFNPSLLVDTPDTLSFGIAVASQQIGVSLAGRPGTQFAIPEGIESATRADGSRFESYPIATKLLQRGRLMTARRSELAARPRQAVDSGHDTRAYGVLGMVVRLFDQRLAVGLHSAGLQTNNPGWPGFGSQGWLLGMSLYVAVSR
ncbi:MAG TPA: hypothetical protein VFN67_34265 [Polyangiales bacterium]|nr:hypothetical protein [Polyangiales bacterium]